MATEQKVKQLLRGVVVSDKMDKTVMVMHERTHRHPTVHKVIKTVKKYKVHDEKEQARVGDVIEFYEGRPASKTKYMYLERIVSSQA